MTLPTCRVCDLRITAKSADGRCRACRKQADRACNRVGATRPAAGAVPAAMGERVERLRALYAASEAGELPPRSWVEVVPPPWREPGEAA